MGGSGSSFTHWDREERKERSYEHRRDTWKQKSEEIGVGELTWAKAKDKN